MSLGATQTEVSSIPSARSISSSVEIPASVLARIDRVAAHLGATKTDVLLAILNEHLDAVPQMISQSLPPRRDTVAYSQGRTGTPADLQDDLAPEQKFRRLANEWHRETDHLSNIVRKVMSSAYQEIIGMGEKALPLILRDLETTGGHWFWALKAIAGFDAAAGTDNYDDAVRAWLKWGSDHGYCHSGHAAH